MVLCRNPMFYLEKEKGKQKPILFGVRWLPKYTAGVPPFAFIPAGSDLVK